MTGIGFGIARETRTPWLRWVAPIGGYFCAMFAALPLEHGATISGFLTVLMLPLWLLFVRGVPRHPHRTRRPQGPDHPGAPAGRGADGDLTREELDLVCSPISSWRATWSVGRRARAGASCGPRRASGSASGTPVAPWRGRKRTVSADWIVPLRQELFELARGDLASPRRARSRCRRRGRRARRRSSSLPSSSTRLPAQSGGNPQGWHPLAGRLGALGRRKC